MPHSKPWASASTTAFGALRAANGFDLSDCQHAARHRRWHGECWAPSADRAPCDSGKRGSPYGHGFPREYWREVSARRLWIPAGRAAGHTGRLRESESSFVRSSAVVVSEVPAPLQARETRRGSGWRHDGTEAAGPGCPARHRLRSRRCRPRHGKEGVVTARDFQTSRSGRLRSAPRSWPGACPINLRSSAGFAGATIPGGRLRKGGEAPLRVS